MLLCAITTGATAAPLDTADEFKSALEKFNPAVELPNFTANPSEALLTPEDGQDALKSQGLAAVMDNDAAHFVYTQKELRTRAISNPNSPEMQYAEQLIEKSADVKEGGCYAQPPKCTTNTTTEFCLDTIHYTTENCRDTLTVSMKQTVHKSQRLVTGVNQQSNPPLDLSQCKPNESTCSAIVVSPNCQSVTVLVSLKGETLETSIDQTCKNLMLTIYSKIHGIMVWVDVTVIEHSAEDAWDKHACQTLLDRASSGVCLFESGEPCIDANKTKLVDGTPVARACWGSAMQYQCRGETESTCASLINKPFCTQTLSSCVAKNWGVCTEYSETFECTQTTCISQPDICIAEPYCLNGECNQTKNEESSDMGEGVSRLGALLGAASDVAINQINVNQAKIFAGEVMTCEKHMLGMRNCCSDSGWADWVINCPKNMQDLHRAIDDGRALYLGKYEDGFLDTDKHYVYCIFPTKLGAIIQMEGRGTQLHVLFGNAEHPDCRGITPKELERIDFASLNLSPIEKELVDRLSPPDSGNASMNNQTHIERLNLEQKPHD